MDPIQKESTSFAYRLYMSKKTLSLIISGIIVLAVLGTIFLIYKKNQKPKQTQIEKSVEAVAQKAASISTTDEEKQKMLETLNKQESVTVSPEESKTADEDLINQFLKN